MMQWRRGTVRITDDHLIALIELAQADEATLLKVRQEMAGTPSARKHWGSLLDRMGAAVVAVAVGAIALAHPGAHEGWQAAAALPFLAITPSFYTLCEIGSCPGSGGSGCGSALAFHIVHPPRSVCRRELASAAANSRPACHPQAPLFCNSDDNSPPIPRAGREIASDSCKAGTDNSPPSGDRTPTRRPLSHGRAIFGI